LPWSPYNTRSRLQLSEAADLDHFLGVIYSVNDYAFYLVHLTAFYGVEELGIYFLLMEVLYTTKSLTATTKALMTFKAAAIATAA